MTPSLMTYESYQQWLEENQEELTIRAAENGMDREYDFDFDDWAEMLYDIEVSKSVQ